MYICIYISTCTHTYIHTTYSHIWQNNMRNGWCTINCHVNITKSDHF